MQFVRGRRVLAFAAVLSAASVGAIVVVEAGPAHPGWIARAARPPLASAGDYGRVSNE
jgi:hypothetical protein